MNVRIFCARVSKLQQIFNVTAGVRRQPIGNILQSETPLERNMTNEHVKTLSKG